MTDQPTFRIIGPAESQRTAVLLECSECGALLCQPSLQKHIKWHGYDTSAAERE